MVFALISAVLLIVEGRVMYRTSNDSEIKLRLNQINRMSVELSATSSALANLAAQLSDLRGERATWDFRRSPGLLKPAKRGRVSFAQAAGKLT